MLKFYVTAFYQELFKMTDANKIGLIFIPIFANFSDTRKKKDIWYIENDINMMHINTISLSLARGLFFLLTN